jgi:sugar lactone lactonase YvrE
MCDWIPAFAGMTEEKGHIMSGISVDLVLDAKATLGEGPVWSVDEQRLYWVDIMKNAIHRADPATGKDEVRDLGEQVGCLGLRAQPDARGNLVAALRSGFHYVDFDAGKKTFICDPENKPQNRMNDGRCDPYGAFWAGSMLDPSDRKTRTGAIWRLAPDGTATMKVDDIGISNGIAFDAERHYFYCADTYADVQTVWRFDHDPDTGAIPNRRVFVTTHDLPGQPDGACIDVEGCYWVALTNCWSIARFTPDGKLDRMIELPVQKPTMCVFGGADMSTLFITSMGFGYLPQADGQPHAGGVFACRPGVRGVADGKFGG